MQNHSHSTEVFAIILVALGAMAACDRSRGNEYQMESATGTVALDGASWIRDSLRSDALILSALRATNEMAIEASRVAQTRASHSDVRAFATQMTTDYTRLNRRVDSLAKALDIKLGDPPGAIEDINERNVDSLRQVNKDTGTVVSPFDRAFMEQQVGVHRLVLDLIDTSIERAQKTELKTALQKEVRPVVAGHLQRAEALQMRIVAEHR